MVEFLQLKAMNGPAVALNTSTVLTIQWRNFLVPSWIQWSGALSPNFQVTELNCLTKVMFGFTSISSEAGAQSKCQTISVSSKIKQEQSLMQRSHKMNQRGGAGFRLLYSYTPDPTPRLNLRVGALPNMPENFHLVTTVHIWNRLFYRKISESFSL